MRILVALITMQDFVYAETCRSLLQLNKTGLDVDFQFISHSITSAARNVAAAKAVGENFDRLVFLDMDMTFHPDTLIRLCSHDVPVVSGLYRARRGDPSPYFAFNFDPDTGFPKMVLDIDQTGPELVPVDGVPTGCLAIKPDVFRDLDAYAVQRGFRGPSAGQPYFWYESRLDRLVRAIEDDMIADCHLDVVDALRYKPGFGRGEDLRFCASCKAAGIPIFIDTRLTAGHLAIREMGRGEIWNG